MTTLPNPFITNSASARTSPGAGDAAAMRPPPVPAAADFPNPAMPTAGSAVLLDLPPVIGGTAAPFHSSDGGVEGHAQSHALGLPPKYNRCGKWKPEGALPEGFGASKDEPAGIKPGPSDYEPSMTNGGDQEAPVGSAPNTAAPAGAFDFDWRAFWEAIMDERIVLFEPFVEHPMFVIEDGYLQRTEA